MDRQCSSCGGFCKKSGCERENTKPKREWVGITEDEAKELYEYSTTEWQFVQAIEARLKEKNNG